MKKYIIGGIVVILLVLGLFGLNKIMNKEETQDKLIYISGNEFLEKLEKKDSFVAVVSQTGCSHCQEYLPILNSVLEDKNQVAYVINLTELAKEDENIQSEVHKIINDNVTPITIFYHEGVEKTTLNRLVGKISRKGDIKKALEKQGF